MELSAKAWEALGTIEHNLRTEVAVCRKRLDAAKGDYIHDAQDYWYMADADLGLFLEGLEGSVENLTETLGFLGLEAFADMGFTRPKVRKPETGFRYFRNTNDKAAHLSNLRENLQDQADAQEVGILTLITSRKGVL
jgi:hypothetical protein